MFDEPSIREIVNAVRSGESSAAAITQACFERIAALNEQLNAFREVYPERAMEMACAVDRRVGAGGDPGPLAGVPIAIKDNIVTDFGTTTAGSRILEQFQSPYMATAAARLVEAGAVLIGKTNCDEFAMGSSTEHCAYGATRNPWDTRRVTGGSSGGSAAAVASGMCPVALGSDTGGSVRQPAGLCGVVGVKPSYGRVSRWGLIAYGSSLDQIGVFARRVDDAARVLEVIAGFDERDSTSADLPVPNYADQIDEPIDPLRIGLPAQYLSDDNDAAVNQAVAAAVETFRDLGAEIVDIDLPLTDFGIATFYVIAPAEASSNLARYDGIRYGRRGTLEAGETLDDLYARSRAEGFGPEVQRRIMLGTYVLSAGYYDAYYKRALQARRLIKQEFDRAFSQCQAIIGPVSPMPAFLIGEKKQDPLTMYLCDVYTTGANCAGICGICVPGGFAEVEGRRLPIGLQIQCQTFDELTMLRVAKLFEAHTEHHLPVPAAGAST